MDEETFSRLKSIYDDFYLQLEESACPILILLSIDDSDLSFLRSQIKEISSNRNVIKYREEFQLLFAYLVVDTIYENYGDAKYNKGTIWSIIKEATGDDDSSKIFDDFYYTLESYGLRIIDRKYNHDKSRMNTILLNSSSRYYSDKFFSFVYNIYRKLSNDLSYDYQSAIQDASKEYVNKNYNSLGNSFAILVKETDMFPSVCEYVLKKIDAKTNGDDGEDLGRWEPAFNKWFNELGLSSFRRPIKITLYSNDSGYFLKIELLKTHTGEDHIINKIEIGKESRIIKRTVSSIRGNKVVKAEEILIPIKDIDFNSEIKITENDKIEVFKLPLNGALFFDNNSKIVKNLSNSTYTVLIKTDDYDFKELDVADAGYGIHKIKTILEKNVQYHIDGKQLMINAKKSGKVSFEFKNIEGTIVKCKEFDTIVPAHPVIYFNEIFENAHIVLKNYCGTTVEDIEINEPIDYYDLNETQHETGKYTLKVYLNKGSLFTKKYVLIDGLSYEPDRTVTSMNNGMIKVHTNHSDYELQYANNDMYVDDSHIINGKKIHLDVRTPNIFYNLDVTNPDSWKNGIYDELSKYDFNNNLLISPGCIPDGKIIKLVFRTADMYSKVYDGMTEGEFCEFHIPDSIQYFLDKKRLFTLDLECDGKIYNILRMNTVGKYDIDSKNGILIITPYYMPNNCKLHYHYRTNKMCDDDWITLRTSKIFDISGLVDLKITELDTDNNEELIIVDKNSYSRSSEHKDLYRTPDEYSVDYAKQYLNGYNCEIDVDRALSILENMIDNGSRRAALELARIYISGKAFPKNYEKASYYLNKYDELTSKLNNSTDAQDNKE